MICRVAIIFLFMLIREKWKSKLLMWFSLYSYEIEITSEVTGRAPTPELTIGVKQSGKCYNFFFILTFHYRYKENMMKLNTLISHLIINPGYVIDDELTVKPGTPLNMEISLDQKSKDIYGLLVSNMRVTDTRDQEENLIING